MKKNRINAFTLVEMLIVIVIIGILIAALMPRMQAAQGRARDVARKTALSQVQSAIVTSQGDKGERPGQVSLGATGGIGLSVITKELTTAGMNSVPQDPLKSDITGVGGKTITGGDYAYIVTRRNGTPNGGFALMAKTEVEGGSNWVVCGSGSDAAGSITGGTDIARITLCDKIIQTGATSTTPCANNYSGTCIYSKDSQLRYLIVY